MPSAIRNSPVEPVLCIAKPPEIARVLGIDEVYCMSVNDAFVMYQWGVKLGANNVKLLPDGNGEFSRKMGMLVEKSNLGFGMRSWRYLPAQLRRELPAPM